MLNGCVLQRRNNSANGVPPFPAHLHMQICELSEHHQVQLTAIQICNLRQTPGHVRSQRQVQAGKETVYLKVLKQDPDGRVMPSVSHAGLRTPSSARSTVTTHFLVSGPSVLCPSQETLAQKLHSISSHTQRWNITKSNDSI